MKARIITGSIFLLMIAALSVIFIHNSNTSSAQTDQDIQDTVIKQIPAAYMDFNGEILITEASIQFTAVDIVGHQVSDFPKEMALDVYYKTGNSETWVLDMYSIDGDKDKCGVFYSWSRPGYEENKNFDHTTIDHIVFDGNAINID